MGAGADRFDITAIAGQITRSDFTPSQGDMLVWDDIAGLGSLASLNNDTIQSGGQTTINLTPSGTNLVVTLANYSGILANSLFLTT